MLKRIIKFYKRKRLSCEEYAREMGANIGKDCYISTKAFSSEAYLITIGDNVRIAKGVVFFTHGGAWPFRDRLGDNFDMFGKIKVGNNVHIGQGAYIMPGVTIGDNVIIGAGAVVTKSIPDNSIAGGNPVKVFGNVDEFIERSKKLNLESKKMTYEEKKKFLLSLPEDRFIKK